MFYLESLNESSDNFDWDHSSASSLDHSSPCLRSLPSRQSKRGSSYRLIKWSIPPPPSVAASLPGWTPMPYGLDSFWQSAFAWFFRPFWLIHNHLWTFEPVELPPLSCEWPWHSATYSAKIRFQCNEQHAWTSLKGRVVFWYRIRRQGNQIISEVLFKLYGQQCKKCQDNNRTFKEEFVAPLWYPEEVENAIRALSLQVMQTYYGGVNRPSLNVPRLRQGKRKLSLSAINLFHDAERCQACREHLCFVLQP